MYKCVYEVKFNKPAELTEEEVFAADWTDNNFDTLEDAVAFAQTKLDQEPYITATGVEINDDDTEDVYETETVWDSTKAVDYPEEDEFDPESVDPFEVFTVLPEESFAVVNDGETPIKVTVENCSECSEEECCSKEDLVDENPTSEESLTEHVNSEPEAVEASSSVKKPDNAVVDCEVYTVVSHSEDEKPLDCKMEKEILPKELTESLNDEELSRFMKAADMLGLKTMGDIDKYSKNHGDLHDQALLDQMEQDAKMVVELSEALSFDDDWDDEPETEAEYFDYEDDYLADALYYIDKFGGYEVVKATREKLEKLHNEFDKLKEKIKAKLPEIKRARGKITTLLKAGEDPVLEDVETPYGVLVKIKGIKVDEENPDDELDEGNLSDLRQNLDSQVVSQTEKDAYYDQKSKIADAIQKELGLNDWDAIKAKFTELGGDLAAVKNSDEILDFIYDKCCTNLKEDTTSGLCGDWWDDEEDKQEKLGYIEEGRERWVVTPEDEKVWDSLSDSDRLFLTYSDDMGYWYDNIMDREELMDAYLELASKFSRYADKEPLTEGIIDSAKRFIALKVLNKEFSDKGFRVSVRDGKGDHEVSAKRFGSASDADKYAKAMSAKPEVAAVFVYTEADKPEDRKALSEYRNNDIVNDYVLGIAKEIQTQNKADKTIAKTQSKGVDVTDHREETSTESKPAAAESKPAEKPVEPESKPAEKPEAEVAKPAEEQKYDTAKLNALRKHNKDILKAFQDAGLDTKDLTVAAIDKNGKSYKKASKQLNGLRKALFGEALEDTEYDDIPLDFEDQMDYLAKDEDEAIEGYEKVIDKVEDERIAAELEKIKTEEEAHKDFLETVKEDPTAEYVEPLSTEEVEETVPEVENYFDEDFEDKKLNEMSLKRKFVIGFKYGDSTDYSYVTRSVSDGYEEDEDEITSDDCLGNLEDALQFDSYEDAKEWMDLNGYEIFAELDGKHGVDWEWDDAVEIMPYDTAKNMHHAAEKSDAYDEEIITSEEISLTPEQQERYYDHRNTWYRDVDVVSKRPDKDKQGNVLFVFKGPRFWLNHSISDFKNTDSDNKDDKLAKLL